MLTKDDYLIELLDTEIALLLAGFSYPFSRTSIPRLVALSMFHAALGAKATAKVFAETFWARRSSG